MTVGMALCIIREKTAMPTGPHHFSTLFGASPAIVYTPSSELAPKATTCPVTAWYDIYIYIYYIHICRCMHECHAIFSIV